MNKLYMTIATAMLSIAAFAQPAPTTFLDVQITGSKETVAEQLMEAVFTQFTKLSMYMGQFMGEDVKVLIRWNETVKQVSLLIVETRGRYDAPEVIKRFNSVLSEYEKDSKYTTDPSNKKMPAGATLSDEYLSSNNNFQAKFYQDGDKKKLITIAVYDIDNKFYIRWDYWNKYNTPNRN